jgi:nicotinamidase-related amidase
MSSVIDLRTYVGASSGRLLVMVDLQKKNYDALAKDNASGLSRSLDNCLSAIRHARNFGIPIAFTRHGGGPDHRAALAVAGIQNSP